MPIIHGGIILIDTDYVSSYTIALQNAKVLKEEVAEPEDRVVRLLT